MPYVLMNPGKLDEQPMPLMVTTLWLGICSSTRAFSTAARTPKSPHPGHQSGSTLPFRSAIVTCHFGCRAVAMSSSPQEFHQTNFVTPMSSHQDLVLRNRELRLAAQLLLHRLDNVMGHKWFPIVLSDVTVSYETGFTAQVAGKLSAVIVLDDDGMSSIFENVNNGVAVQRHQPANLQLIRGNALFGQNLTSFFYHSLG